jgi:hypothetical protein
VIEYYAKKQKMAKDPISSIIVYYILSIPCMILIYVVLGISTQPGDQIPLLFLISCPYYLPIFGVVYCIYSLVCYENWGKVDKLIMGVITLGHLSLIIWLWSYHI